jgi:hypothetical protein
MKALGIHFEPDLSWNRQVDSALSKSHYVVKRIRYLSKWLTKDDRLKLVTSQYFSILYYAAPVWIGSLNVAAWKRLNSAHYRALRAVVGFHVRKRSEIDLMTKRAKPPEWARYSIASTVIKLYNSSDTNIAKTLRSSAYVNDRLPRRAKFIDQSKFKVGKQSLPNRIGYLFSKMKFDWIGDITDDMLRKSLKKEFFEYFE